MQLTEEQLKVMATATVVYPARFTIEEERTDDRAVCDSLVERGDLERVEDVEGGYRASDEFAAAMGKLVDRRAEQAATN